MGSSLEVILPLTALAYLSGTWLGAISVCRWAGRPDPRLSGSCNPGFSNVLRQHGVPLALATLEAERYLGRDAWLGSIEIGKRADFFLIPNDPLEDISNIREIRLVMKDGVAYLPAEIHRALGIQPFAEPVTLPGATQ